MRISTLTRMLYFIVFADSDIQTRSKQFTQAVSSADIFIASLIFDYDDVVAITNLFDEQDKKNNKKNSGPRLVFECATELMS